VRDTAALCIEWRTPALYFSLFPWPTVEAGFRAGFADAIAREARPSIRTTRVVPAPSLQDIAKAFTQGQAPR